MLMSDELLSYYPTIKDNTTNFVRYYLDHFDKIDRAFYLRYASCEPVLMDEKSTFPSIYNEWIENCNAFILYYMDSWARLFYGLNIDYNPIHNYDGVMTTTTKGKTEGTSGSDITTLDYGQDRTTDNIGAQHIQHNLGGAKTTTINSDNTTDNIGAQHSKNNLGQTKTTTTNSDVPYDMTAYKDTSKSETNTDAILNEVNTDAVTNTSKKEFKSETNTNAVVNEINTDAVINTSTKDAKTDTNTTVYGKQNNVDYTVTEEKGGNLGITSTQSMLLQEFELRLKSFFDNLFTTISRELLIR